MRGGVRNGIKAESAQKTGNVTVVSMMEWLFRVDLSHAMN